jgi:hypothetical protein
MAPILIDQSVRIKLRVDHHGVETLVTEERLNHMRRCTVVEVLGGEDSTAIVRRHQQRTAIVAARTRTPR